MIFEKLLRFFSLRLRGRNLKTMRKRAVEKATDVTPVGTVGSL